MKKRYKLAPITTSTFGDSSSILIQISEDLKISEHSSPEQKIISKQSLIPYSSLTPTAFLFSQFMANFFLKSPMKKATMSNTLKKLTVFSRTSKKL